MGKLLAETGQGNDDPVCVATVTRLSGGCGNANDALLSGRDDAFLRLTELDRSPRYT